MKIFIAGICGTFMAGIAQIAEQLGVQVTGCDDNVYPPMSTRLADAGIAVKKGYSPDCLDTDIDLAVIGNVLSRGNPLVESILERGLAYTSGAQWLHDHVLTRRNVIAVAGTHGKTTTASMIAWILSQANMDPGYLIGGQPGNFAKTAELGSSEWFVIEADEYDCAFFDKRSKFVHYHPHVAVLNNLEFDHGDIYDSVKDIKKQFHHLLRIVPPNGVVVANRDDRNVLDVLDRGCWSPVEFTSLRQHQADWHAKVLNRDHSRFDIYCKRQKVGSVNWQCIGAHNLRNALSAIAACHAAGVATDTACTALEDYIPAKRRLECLSKTKTLCLYEDFAHHPTAIRVTLEALRSKHPDSRVIAIIDPGSNTMSCGMHGDALGRSLKGADQAIFYVSRDLAWNPNAMKTKTPTLTCRNHEQVLEALQLNLADNTVIICMGNRSFDGVPAWLAQQLEPSC
ncbi:MAG: UDP-N-acetylmuramate:L-alanyl-gamma-D-glutamyl-meso-diaminopimelate ligase [Gammaproteobacteria bacterium]|nr:UDP-N-acetylmuramate:L-alanyl-gamma-D-glutamyl-meso-diaminopimelate ligase [Gammaproteobacteria bacterium]MCY4228403.1 UDP-N-acetylmuramate:L-alanyl-gamma-D-glutamyl-meso-diaminopimelate ligase [Gammaproteobacteria bacterium]MCY4313225.1 UDP-N-acetylmuramate:L-alanyl-gamma-D-glutamyl-meso-diaminopimelate ligase [Gammaproteobacteria bacterium]